MSGVIIQTELDVVAAAAGLARLNAAELDVIAYDVGALIEDQTKRRIAEEKTAPDGTPWAPWSQGYAASLKRRNKVTARSLLVGNRHLMDSIRNATTGEEIKVGTELLYGAIHQFGGDTSQGHPAIPARPYLGLSEANSREIEDRVADLLEDLLQ